MPSDLLTALKRNFNKVQGWNHPRESFMGLILKLRWDHIDRKKFFKNALWAQAIFETIPKNVFWELIRKGFEEIKTYLPEIEDKPFYTPLSNCEVYFEDSITSPYTPHQKGKKSQNIPPCQKTK